MKICITNALLASLLHSTVNAKRKLSHMLTEDESSPNGGLYDAKIVGGDQSDLGEFPYYGKSTFSNISVSS